MDVKEQSHFSFIKTTCKAFVFIGLFYGLLHPFLVVNFFRMPVSTYWIQGAYDKKEKAALQINEPKILLVAGSSVHFGLNAEKISKELKTPTINYGVMALIGLDYTLYRAKKVLKPGDTVILPLEYYHYNFDPADPYSVQKSYYLLTHDQDYFFNHISLWQKIKILYSINPTHLLSALIEQIKLRTVNGLDSGMYRVKTINEYGDETAQNKPVLKGFSPDSFPEPSEAFLKEIQVFSAYCKAHNITVFFSFPNIPYFEVYESDSYKEVFQRLLTTLKTLEIPILGTPYDAMMEKEYIFDTTNHLIPLGIKKRTEKFLNILKPLMKH